MVNGIPIYINQALVLDLAALMFDGFEESRNIRNRGEAEVHLRRTQENRFQETIPKRSVVNNENDLGNFHGEIEFAKDVNSRIIFTDFSRFNSVRTILQI
mgnify:CR=1 FL=1